MQKSSEASRRTTLRRCGTALVLAMAIASSVGLAQTQESPPPAPPSGTERGGMERGASGRRGEPRPFEARRPPLERALHVGPPGRWWNNPEFAQKLGLSAEQQRQMDSIFQQSRLKLIDLSAALQKQEIYMEPLLGADHPDEGAILAQIDRVAQARADLEKANARMLLELRGVLKPEQWKTLQADEPREDRRGPRGPVAPKD